LGLVLLILGTFGIQLPPQITLTCYLPAFLILVPAILVSRRLTAPFTEKEIRKNGWKIILRGCPAWMINAMKIWGWITMASFLMLIFSPKTSRDAIMLRFMFPIYGMFLSGYSAATFYSALLVNSEIRFCLQGHELTPLQKFCPECGNPVLDSRPKQDLTN
jgi:hypothetical protein